MRYAIFDIETRIDKRLLAESLYRGRGLDEDACYDEFRRTLIEDRGHDFFPLSLHVPISIAIGSVSEDHLLESVESLCEGNYDERRLVQEFWERVERFEGSLVSFNGRRFDLPVLELAALAHGCAAPRYFDPRHGRRRRPTEEAHYDLLDFLTDGGTHRIRGGFDLLARRIGLPGKGDVDGSQVQRLWEEGRLAEIHRYCRRDVVQTYFLFLRLELLRGRIGTELYRELLERTSSFAAEL